MIPRTRLKPRTHRCPGCLGRSVARKCPTCGTLATTKRGNIGKRCDALWSQIIKAPGKCFRCGAVEGLQAAHIIGRAQRVTRWLVSPPNGIPLCHKCHRLFDTWKIDRNALINKYLGGVHRHDWLLEIGRGTWDKHYPLAELTAQLKQAKGEAA